MEKTTYERCDILRCLLVKMERKGLPTITGDRLSTTAKKFYLLPAHFLFDFPPDNQKLLSCINKPEGLLGDPHPRPHVNMLQKYD